MRPGWGVRLPTERFSQESQNQLRTSDGSRSYSTRPNSDEMSVEVRFKLSEQGLLVFLRKTL